MLVYQRVNINADTGFINPPQKVRVDLARSFLVPPYINGL